MHLIILGAGQYGRVIEDIARQSGAYESIRFLDDGACSPAVLGKMADFPQYMGDDTVFHVAVGHNTFRGQWVARLQQAGAPLSTIVHPTAYVSPTACLGQGVAVLPRAVVNSYTTIEDGCIINTGAIVDHDCTIRAYAHVCVGAIVKADNCIPSLMKIDAGVVIENETYKGE